MTIVVSTEVAAQTTTGMMAVPVKGILYKPIRT